MRLTLLGTGTSFGVPQIGCDCAVCHSTDPKDRRFRTAALIEEGGRTLLIDTPPELRLQLLAADTKRIDGVLFTHEHADHVAGIDDLRMFSLRQKATLSCYGSRETVEFLRRSYRYIFDPSVTPYEGTSKPRLVLEILEPGRLTAIAGLPVLALAFEHGHSTVLGYRVGPVAYLTDVKSVPEGARRQLAGVSILVLNALWWRPHPTHLSIAEAIEVARAIGARRTILTHLTHETSHADLLARLPEGIEPGFDGQTVEVTL